MQRSGLLIRELTASVSFLDKYEVVDGLNEQDFQGVGDDSLQYCYQAV